MSPQYRLGLQRLKKNKLALGCMLLLSILLCVSMAAELIANDKPLLISYQQKWYFPVFKRYPETTFGGVFESEADYQDPVVQQLILQKGWMLRPWIDFAENTPNLALAVPVPSPPSAQNWLGTDDQGRDVLARILYGLRISLWFGVALTAASAVLGILFGALQGYFGGWLDLLGQRVLEVWTALPQVFVLMLLVSMFSPNLFWLFVSMLFFGWTYVVNLVRVECLRVRNLDYVRAARGLGLSHRLIIWRHVLPNALGATLSQLPFMLTANISALSALDFLGYGLPPDMASLGELLQQGKNNLSAPWLILSGFCSLALLLCLLLYIGEALRDAFDPRGK
jgi:microcin C transport system permease protein